MSIEQHETADQLPFHIHVALNVCGATPEDLQQALKEACEQLAQGIPESHTVMKDQKSGFTFKVTAKNLDDNKPSPVPPPPQFTPTTRVQVNDATFPSLTDGTVVSVRHVDGDVYEYEVTNRLETHWFQAEQLSAKC
ncbi:hypothetical protein [Pseudomonas sp. 2FE]|uniref:hypothetical protein n=1 Tax=Pseudomonas sp. 2FE TaxID=2502190 RepID=UPI0010FA3305|nr:hypothetical protein [Pseudomonas sp. 2FE]